MKTRYQRHTTVYMRTQLQNISSLKFYLMQNYVTKQAAGSHTMFPYSMSLFVKCYFHVRFTGTYSHVLLFLPCLLQISAKLFLACSYCCYVLFCCFALVTNLLFLSFNFCRGCNAALNTIRAALQSLQKFIDRWSMNCIVS